LSQSALEGCLHGIPSWIIPSGLCPLQPSPLTLLPALQIHATDAALISRSEGLFHSSCEPLGENPDWTSAAKFKVWHHRPTIPPWDAKRAVHVVEGDQEHPTSH
jgi:hypothetical protein